MLTRKEKFRLTWWRWLVALVAFAVMLFDLLWRPELWGLYAFVYAVCCAGWVFLALGKIRLAERSRKIDSWWERFGSAG